MALHKMIFEHLSVAKLQNDDDRKRRQPATFDIGVNTSVKEHAISVIPTKKIRAKLIKTRRLI
jgi:hypothetical protein